MTKGKYDSMRSWKVPSNDDSYIRGYLIEYNETPKGFLDNLNWMSIDEFKQTYFTGGSMMKEVVNPLLTNKYTRVLHEDTDLMQYNAPHHFEVYADAGQPAPYLVGQVDFQEGPIKEAGVNGVMNEDLIAMVITRLEHFNQTDFRCKENSMAITKLEEALLWLRKRTMGREQRGVEGTHIK